MIVFRIAVKDKEGTIHIAEKGMHTNLIMTLPDPYDTYDLGFVDEEGKYYTGEEATRAKEEYAKTKP